MSVILLSCLKNVMLVPILKRLQEAKIPVEAVFMDGELPLRAQRFVKRRLLPGYQIGSVEGLDEPEIPFYFVHDHNNFKVIEKISRLNSAYLVNAGSPRILKKEILSVKRGVINCHPGLLPDYRGCTCLEWAVYNDDPVGATVHFMNIMIDNGPIIYKSELPWKRGGYAELRTAMVDFMARTLTRGVKLCMEKQLDPATMPAQPEGKYYQTISRYKLKIVKQKLLIHCHESF